LTTYAYDNANQLTSVTDRNGRQTTYSYDQVGNKTGETWVGGSYIATYGYDSANRLTVEQDTFSKYTLGYDNASRLTSVDNLGTPNMPRVLLTYGYDNFSNRTSIQDNSGGTEALTYDSDNNLTNVNISKSTWTNSNTVTLGYDTANRLTSLIRQWGNKNLGFTQVQTTYGYDNADRLTGITHLIVGGSTLMTLTYGYDNANQLTSYSGPDGSITYGYDVDGQLTGATGAHNETYTYDKEGNRTMTGYVTSIGNRLTSDGTYSYTYDQDGNMLTQTRISDGQVTSYTWDFRNRLTEVLIKTSGATTVQDDKFTYDIENRRIGKNTLIGGQTWTAYVDSNPYADFNSSGSLTFWHLYAVAIDSLLGRVDSSGNTMWYLTDKLGSVRENTDGNGNVLDSITYDTYGNILAENHPTSGDRFKFTSHEWDSEIGQYFYRARYYSPTDGRFESEDPKGFAAGDNDLYRYVGNNPVTRSDPLGEDQFMAEGIDFLFRAFYQLWDPHVILPLGQPFGAHLDISGVFPASGTIWDVVAATREAAERVDHALIFLEKNWNLLEVDDMYRTDGMGHKIPGPDGEPQLSTLYKFIKDNRRQYLIMLHKVDDALKSSGTTIPIKATSERPPPGERNIMYTKGEVWSGGTIFLRNTYWLAPKSGTYGRAYWTVHEFARYFLGLEDDTLPPGVANDVDGAQTWDRVVNGLAGKWSRYHDRSWDWQN
jgi:RHS repeat-associated protein